jgi:hypothetical protein
LSSDYSASFTFRGGGGSPGLRSGAIDPGRIVAQVASRSEALGGESGAKPLTHFFRAALMQK